MAHLQLAILLSIVVACVLVATRPVEPRRRASAGATRIRAGRAGSEQPASTRPTDDVSHRNRWDRADILLAVGRDHADPDASLTAWPAPTGTSELRLV